MVDHVLVALDGSEQAWQALEYALREFPDASKTVVYVIDPVGAGFSPQTNFPGYSEEWYEEAKAEAETLFESARERAEEQGERLSTDVVHGRPAEEIVRYAEDDDVDQIVMGSHGRSGVSRMLLGSVAEAVVRRSPVPVTVVR